MTTTQPIDVDAALARIREKKCRETQRQQPQTGDASLFSQFAAPAWPLMDEAAYHGLAGEVVRAIEPHSEADPNGILIHFLVAFGNAIGPTCHYQIEGDQHRAKLFVVTSGATSKGRKGTALGGIRQLMAIAASDWEKGNIRSGLSSGEGVIFHVRDPVMKINADGTEEKIDGGVADKRIMLVTEEFVSALSVMERPGNTLSPVLRDAWGTARLETMTKNSPLKATESHISMIGHVTDHELRSALTRTEMANGFANRFLFMKVRRSKQLAHGGHLDHAVLQGLGEKVGAAVGRAQTLGRLTMISEAASAWERVYGELSSERPGLFGAIVGRAEAQVIRLALIYAAIDNQSQISLAHLEAALAVWSYCEDSAGQIFGDLLGDRVADAIVVALRNAGPAGMSRTQISAAFSRHVRTDRITAALNWLEELGRARRSPGATDGRSEERWYFRSGN
jgi:hypothetical protein